MISLLVLKDLAIVVSSVNSTLTVVCIFSIPITTKTHTLLFLFFWVVIGKLLFRFHLVRLFFLCSESIWIECELSFSALYIKKKIVVQPKVLLYCDATKKILFLFIILSFLIIIFYCFNFHCTYITVLFCNIKNCIFW